MAIYGGETECEVIYVNKGGVALRVSSVWAGDKQVFPPTNRQEIHAFNRDTQGYGRYDHGTRFAFTVPVPWWAASMDVVIIGAGEKGRDGTKSFTGGEDGAGGKSGAWVVKTTAIIASENAMVSIGKGTSTAPAHTGVVLLGADGQSVIEVLDGEGTRTPNNGSTGGSVTPQTRTEYNQIHTGARGATRNYAGNHPGAGGGGGEGSNLLGNPKLGQPGGDGYVWLRFRSASALDPGDEVFVLRVGVSSGDAFDPLRAWAVGIGKTTSTITEITVEMEVIGPSLQSLFAYCHALTSIPELDTSQVTNMNGMFAYCHALTSIPELDTSQVTNVGSMFYGCSSLATIPALDTSQVTNMLGMFTNCHALTSIPALDTSQVTNMRSMFNGCSSLTTIPTLNTSRVADVRFMFGGCTSLESVTLPGLGNGFTSGSSVPSRDLNMRDTKLNAAAANALMESLGTPSPGGDLQLPATAAGADTSIARAKNWTVTVG